MNDRLNEYFFLTEKNEVTESSWFFSEESVLHHINTDG